MNEVSRIIDRALDVCESYINIIDDENSKIIIHLDNDIEYLRMIRKRVNDDQNIITISDIDEFICFIHTSGFWKMYIDINMDDTNGIDFAEKLKLNECFGELIFVSDGTPTTEEFKRIEAMGGKFISKINILDII